MTTVILSSLSSVPGRAMAESNTIDGEDLSQLRISVTTMGDLLLSAADRYPDTSDQLLSSEGQLNRYVNVYVNDEDVRFTGGLETALSDGDQVVVLPAVAGGGLDRLDHR